MDKNVEYYNENAEAFFANTVDADMSLWRDRFESYIVDGGRILDAGCGSGRDSRAFKQHGYSVVAIDASREMCRFASELLGQEVWQMRFDEMAFDQEFDGVWACASLLHVSKDKLPDIIAKIHGALKKNGFFYASFKYGEESTKLGDRTFTNFTELPLLNLISNGFEVVENAVSSDVRNDRSEEKWINIIARKV